MSNFKSIGQGDRGLRLPKIGGFPLTLNVALTTVLRTNVQHCDIWDVVSVVLSLIIMSSDEIVSLGLFTFVFKTLQSYIMRVWHQMSVARIQPVR